MAQCRVDRRITDAVVLGTDLVSDLEWRHSRIYTELCQPHTDVFHGVMVTAGMLLQGLWSRARAKTGTASQTDLIRAVLLSLAPTGSTSR